VSELHAETRRAWLRREAAERAYARGLEAIRGTLKSATPRERYRAALLRASVELAMCDDDRAESVRALLRIHARA
jgi:hypothetical protein